MMASGVSTSPHSGPDLLFYTFLRPDSLVETLFVAGTTDLRSTVPKIKWINKVYLAKLRRKKDGSE